MAPVPLRAFLSSPLCPSQKTTPEGEDAGTGPADPTAAREISIMATKTAPKSAKPVQKPQTRQAVTLEMVKAITPVLAKADKMVATYGLEPVDYDAIREGTEEQVVRICNGLTDNLNEKAMAIFLQRIVGSFVSAAYGAATFYGSKKSDALALHSKLLNDARDEDRDGVAGFESKQERAFVFAAEMGLQAHALMAAAEGAVHAYAHITGDEWKPYEAAIPAASTVQRRSADAMRAALEE